MRKKNSYSRLVQNMKHWEQLPKGLRIQLFHHCIEKGITSFMVNLPGEELPQGKQLGTALSESGLSRDEIQLLAVINCEGTPDDFTAQVEEIIEDLRTDYLDLIFLNAQKAEKFLPAIEQLVSQSKILEVGSWNASEGSEVTTSAKMNFRASLSTFEATPGGLKTLDQKFPPSEDRTQMLFIEPGDFAEKNPEVEAMAQKYELSQQELLLAWILNRRQDLHPVLGVKELSGIDAAKKAFSTRISEKDLRLFPDIIIEPQNPFFDTQ